MNVGPSLLGRWLTRSGRWTFRLKGGEALLETPDGRYSTPLQDRSSVAIRPGRIWSRLDVATRDGRVIVGGLPNARARTLSRALEAAIAPVPPESPTCVVSTDTLAQTVERLLAWHAVVRDRVSAAGRERRWLSRAVAPALLERCPLEPPIGRAVRAAVADGGIALERSHAAAVLEALDWHEGGLASAIDARNERFFQAELPLLQDGIRRRGGQRLTDEQARAVVACDERTLLVASAGSGKTHTMVERAVYAVERGFVTPERILMLAFNRKVADELGARTRAALAATGRRDARLTACTFHSLGLMIDGEASGEKKRLAPWARREKDAQRKLAELIERTRRERPAFALDWHLLCLLHPHPGTIEDAPIAHRPPSEVLRSAKGESVASREELAIADWLWLNGIDYRYEQHYRHPTATADRSSYLPDFHYPAIDVYHEHFALRADGTAPPLLEGYDADVAWKRALHRRHGTTLIETTSLQYARGVLFDELERALRAHGLTPRPDPSRTLDARPVIEHRELLALLERFIRRSKSEALSDAALRHRARAFGRHVPSVRSALFVRVAIALRAAWNQALEGSRGARFVDYEDMTVLGVDHIESGAWRSRFDLVLVDEFQDLSAVRRRLVRALVDGLKRSLFAVGDDWQSIYRFGGAEPCVMQDFEAAFGAGTVLPLSRTFRFPQAICDAAGAFVMRNEAQLRKRVTSEVPARGAVFEALIVDRREALPAAVARYLERLHAFVGDAPTPAARASVKVLGRYNRDETSFLPEGWRTRHADRLDIAFSSVHRLKGGEGDDVLLPAALRGSFPSTIESDPVLELVSPVPDAFQHGEERRLFYVALTRARRRVVFFTVRGEIAPFLEELVRAGEVTLQPDHEEGVAPARRCPRCADGVLHARTSRYGPFVVCGARCGYKRDGPLESSE